MCGAVFLRCQFQRHCATTVQSLHFLWCKVAFILRVMDHFFLCAVILCVFGGPNACARLGVYAQHTFPQQACVCSL